MEIDSRCLQTARRANMNGRNRYTEQIHDKYPKMEFAGLQSNNVCLVLTTVPYNSNGMAFWPRDERAETQKLSKLKQETSTDKKLGYPYLEPGLIGAATLSNNSLDWIFLSKWQSVGDGNH